MVTVIKTRVVKGRTIYTVQDGNTRYSTTTKPGSRRRVDWAKHRQLTRQLNTAKGSDWWEVSDQILDVLEGVPERVIYKDH